MFCCTLLYVHSSFAIILMGKRKLFTLLGLSSWCVVIVVWLFLAVPWVCLQFVIVLFPDHTHLLFLLRISLASGQFVKMPITLEPYAIFGSNFAYLFNLTLPSLRYAK